MIQVDRESTASQNSDKSCEERRLPECVIRTTSRRTFPDAVAPEKVQNFYGIVNSVRNMRGVAEVMLPARAYYIVADGGIPYARRCAVAAGSKGDDMTPEG